MTNTDLQPINIFATPDSMEDLQSWIKSASDPYVTTAAMMMYNLLVTNYDMNEKKAK